MLYLNQNHLIDFIIKTTIIGLNHLQKLFPYIIHQIIFYINTYLIEMLLKIIEHSNQGILKISNAFLPL